MHMERYKWFIIPDEDHKNSLRYIPLLCTTESCSVLLGSPPVPHGSRQLIPVMSQNQHYMCPSYGRWFYKHSIIIGLRLTDKILTGNKEKRFHDIIYF